MTIEYFDFSLNVWKYGGKASWYFVTIPQEESLMIRDIYKWSCKNFGSLKVEVRLQDFSWKTSIFFDTKLHSYLLPIKAEIRKKRHISSGNRLDFILKII